MNEISLEAELRGLIGDEKFLALVEERGGTRLYVPRDRSVLTRLIGRENVKALASRYEGSYLRLPLAREFRGRHYRLQGRSNAEIAIKLGMTETGVDKMFARMEAKPVKGAQLDLFEL